MLEKGAIQKVVPTQGQFLSNLSLVVKKDGGNRPVKKFYKNSTNVKNDLLCKIDLKEAYFSVSPNKNSRKFVRFQWSGNLYEFPCLRFGLGPATRIFTKLLKVTIALLRRVNILIMIYLDDMLLMGRPLPEILMARDTLTFLMQHLDFVINLKK